MRKSHPFIVGRVDTSNIAENIMYSTLAQFSAVVDDVPKISILTIYLLETLAILYFCIEFFMHIHNT